MWNIHCYRTSHFSSSWGTNKPRAKVYFFVNKSKGKWRSFTASGNPTKQDHSKGVEWKKPPLSRKSEMKSQLKWLNFLTSFTYLCTFLLHIDKTESSQESTMHDYCLLIEFLFLLNTRTWGLLNKALTENLWPNPQLVLKASKGHLKLFIYDLMI